MVFVLPKIYRQSRKPHWRPFVERFNCIFFFNIFQRNLVFSSWSIDAFLQNYRQSSIKPPPGGEGGYLIQKRRCYQFSIKNFGIQSGKAPVQEGWRSCNWGSESNPNFQMANKPSQISPHEVLQTWLIITIYHLLGKNNQGRGEEEKGAY